MRGWAAGQRVAGPHHLDHLGEHLQKALTLADQLDLELPVVAMTGACRGDIFGLGGTPAEYRLGERAAQPALGERSPPGRPNRTCVHWVPHNQPPPAANTIIAADALRPIGMRDEG